MNICSHIKYNIRGIEMKKENHEYLNEKTVNDVARTFKALADPTRVRILYLLTNEECSVGHIAEFLAVVGFYY